jgi:hypothetical protein
MARGNIDIYKNNYTILVETGWWGLHIGHEQIWALKVPDNEVTRMVS